MSKASKDSVVSIAIEPASATRFDEDAILVDRFLAGDETAFERLYDRYYEKVFAIARGVLIDAEEAADAVQEIFTLVYRHLGRFDRRARFSTWLFRVAVNRAIQETRRNRFKQKSLPLDDSIPTVPEIENSLDPQVESALTKLSPPDRAILVLFYWEQLSLQEIGESLGCNENAAKTRLYRARERFRDVYEGAE